MARRVGIANRCLLPLVTRSNPWALRRYLDRKRRLYGCYVGRVRGDEERQEGGWEEPAIQAYGEAERRFAGAPEAALRERVVRAPDNRAS
jgi:hypothetical protein